MNKTKLLSLLFTLISVFALSQNTEYRQTIRGTVIDKLTQSTLPGATVIVIWLTN